MYVYRDIGDDADFLHVLALGVVNAGAGDAKDRAVDQADGPRSDDVRACGLADELAQAERAEGTRENLRVTVRAILNEQHQRLGPFAVMGTQHRSRAAVTLAEERMFLAAEIVQYLVVRVAAAVVANVEDNRFLVEIVRIERANEVVQALLVHAGNVNVAQRALA